MTQAAILQKEYFRLEYGAGVSESHADSSVSTEADKERDIDLIMQGLSQHSKGLCTRTMAKRVYDELNGDIADTIMHLDEVLKA